MLGWTLELSSHTHAGAEFAGEDSHATVETSDACLCVSRPWWEASGILLSSLSVETWVTFFMNLIAMAGTGLALGGLLRVRLT